MRPGPAYVPPPPGPMAPRTATLALVALGVALVGSSSLQFAFVFLRPLAALGVLCGGAGIVLGALALGRIATSGGRLEGRPMAIGAIVIGALEAIACAGVLAAWLLPR
ncbi:MAG TPA: hypothetical protein VGR57_15775 [Ktedonobacterales bacterium]|nr:hypothetical protein [Ktedonobacterales bacterium]